MQVLTEALSFDDVLLLPNHSEVLPTKSMSAQRWWGTFGCASPS